MSTPLRCPDCNANPQIMLHGRNLVVVVVHHETCPLYRVMKEGTTR